MRASWPVRSATAARYASCSGGHVPMTWTPQQLYGGTTKRTRLIDMKSITGAVGEALAPRRVRRRRSGRASRAGSSDIDPVEARVPLNGLDELDLLEDAAVGEDGLAGPDVVGRAGHQQSPDRSRPRGVQQLPDHLRGDPAAPRGGTHLVADVPAEPPQVLVEDVPQGDAPDDLTVEERPVDGVGHAAGGRGVLAPEDPLHEVGGRFVGEARERIPDLLAERAHL